MKNINHGFSAFKMLLSFILLLSMSMGCSRQQNYLSYYRLTQKLIDLEAISRLPNEGEESGMFSSYDRSSIYDEHMDSFKNWSANNDGFTPQYIRKEGDDMVLAELEGPGAIVRIWSANPKEGHVKIFIDGEDTPILDMPFRDYFNSEAIPVYGFSQLVYETKARGFNNYVPIPFQKSIKIVGEPDWGQYYHFNYIQFPKKTKVEAFNPHMARSSLAGLEAVNAELRHGHKATSKDKKNQRVENVVSLAPGEKKRLSHLLGKKAITTFEVKINGISSEQEKEAYRKTILSMHWDGKDLPSVWSPIGDFFGSAPGYNAYRTYTMGTKDGWMYAHWYMPFAKEAKIYVENLADFEIEVQSHILVEKLKGKASEYGHFHAKWHRDLAPLPSDRWPDWTVLQTKGRGRYVGLFLSVWNPKGGSCKQYGGEGHHWWGEGDEKFFVDGETFPSTFGTGTEDYFGYAWCIPNFFEHGFHSQNYTEGNMGYQSLNRWHIIDNIPFDQSFEAYLEKYFPNHWPTQYAVVPYWYLSPNGKDPLGPVSRDELYGFEKEYVVYRAPFAIEGEDMKIVSNSGGWVTQDAFAPEELFAEISGHKTLLWFAKEDGKNKLTLDFDFHHEGSYEVMANVLIYKDGGVFSAYLNDRLVCDTIDTHQNENFPASRNIKIGEVNLTKGKQTLTFFWNKKQSTGRRLALDCLVLKPLK